MIMLVITLLTLSTAIAWWVLDDNWEWPMEDRDRD